MTTLQVEPYFTANQAGAIPDLNWEKRTATISDADGAVLFEQKDVLFPDFWSQQAINITVHKYFKGPVGTPRRETSLLEIVNRVTRKIKEWAVVDNYLDPKNANVLARELDYILLNQLASFNSPVWFNCGVEDEASSGFVWDSSNTIDAPWAPGYDHVREVSKGEHRPQCSACFITAPDDNMSSILDWVKTEGMIFKQGSGSGCNISKLRSSKERLSSGGTPSGPLAFMQIADQAAGSIKSGGKHRRAAKLVCMNVDHPDILEFIDCKVKEERKARRLIEAGWSAEFNDPENAYHQVFYQNANHSVSVTDEFMRKEMNGRTYQTRAVTSGKAVDELSAGEVLYRIAVSAHECGDPGIQFIDTINNWNPVLDTEKIRSSNPCSEYMFLDDTACNLASLNLMKFMKDDGSFDIEGFCHTVDCLILAQEVFVDRASYPTARIAQRSHEYRTLGLGFANLGAYLMASGLPYDSDEGRNLAGAISSLMTSRAYRRSAQIAERMGEFKGCESNCESMEHVIGKHTQAACTLAAEGTEIAVQIAHEAALCWRSLNAGPPRRYRNAQVTVIAPTGTIGFMMDCDTTGIEPELALVKYKKLVGGGQMKIVNHTVERALQTLGYGVTIPGLLEAVERTGSLEGTGIKEENLAVFDTSFPAGGRTRCIPYMAHLRMMAAVQPFLSGAISKTVNMPSTATPEDIVEVYREAWQLGLKSVAVYRDGCKQSQPMSTKKGSTEQLQNESRLSSGNPGEVRIIADLGDIETKLAAMLTEKAGQKWLADRGLVTPAELEKIKKELNLAKHEPYHRKMPHTRDAVCHKFRIVGHTGYLHIGLFDDCTPGEIFITMAKEGSTISGLMDAFATSLSFNLQYGVPLEKLVSKFKHMKFEPAGCTENEEIRLTDSVVDYIAKFLELRFLTPKLDLNQGTPIVVASDGNVQDLNPELGPEHREYWILNKTGPVSSPATDAPICLECGGLMYRNGSCYLCGSCGSSSGCS